MNNNSGSLLDNLNILGASTLDIGDSDDPFATLGAPAQSSMIQKADVEAVSGGIPADPFSSLNRQTRPAPQQHTKQISEADLRAIADNPSVKNLTTAPAQPPPAPPVYTAPVNAELGTAANVGAEFEQMTANTGSTLNKLQNMSDQDVVERFNQFKNPAKWTTKMQLTAVAAMVIVIVLLLVVFKPTDLRESLGIQKQKDAIALPPNVTSGTVEITATNKGTTSNVQPQQSVQPAQQATVPITQTNDTSQVKTPEVAKLTDMDTNTPPEIFQKLKQQTLDLRSALLMSGDFAYKVPADIRSKITYNGTTASIDTATLNALLKENELLRKQKELNSKLINSISDTHLANSGKIETVPAGTPDSVNDARAVVSYKKLPRISNANMMKVTMLDSGTTLVIPVTAGMWSSLKDNGSTTMIFKKIVQGGKVYYEEFNLEFIN